MAHDSPNPGQDDRPRTDTKELPVLALPVNVTEELQVIEPVPAPPTALPPAVPPPAVPPPAVPPPAAPAAPPPQPPAEPMQWWQPVPQPSRTAPVWQPAPPEPAGYPAPAPPPPPPPQQPPQQPVSGSQPAAREPTRRRSLVYAALAATGIGLGVVTATVLSGAGDDVKPPAASSSPAPAGASVQAQVSSLDPVGGSGFKRTDSGWRTQTYRSATFGNLKSGVGLVLDLGSAKPLSAITFDAGPSPITVQLRAADEAPTTDRGLTDVGRPVQASGSTTLEARAGGSHRYWVIWVSTLGPRDGGFGAVLGQPVARG